MTAEELRKQVEEWELNGGVITHLPYLVKRDSDIHFQNFSSLNNDAAMLYKERGKIKNGKKVTK